MLYGHFCPKSLGLMYNVQRAATTARAQRTSRGDPKILYRDVSNCRDVPLMRESRRIQFESTEWTVTSTAPARRSTPTLEFKFDPLQCCSSKANLRIDVLFATILANTRGAVAANFSPSNLSRRFQWEDQQEKQGENTPVNG